MKIGPVGAELIHADRTTDGRTDITRLIVTFCNFAKARKNKLQEYTVALSGYQTGRTEDTNMNYHYDRE
jgi:hypothetical protein